MQSLSKSPILKQISACLLRARPRLTVLLGLCMLRAKRRELSSLSNCNKGRWKVPAASACSSAVVNQIG